MTGQRVAYYQRRVGSLTEMELIGYGVVESETIDDGEIIYDVAIDRNQFNDPIDVKYHWARQNQIKPI